VKGTRTMHRVLGWVRPRRWSILAEAVLAAVLALAAWPILAVQHNEPPAVDVVTAYLEALRDGDVERAETFIVDPEALEVDRTWLTAEAMSSDWEIESVERKSASPWSVHAVIRSGDARAEGAFDLEGPEDDPLISNPYLFLSNVNPMFTTLEIGGVRGEIEQTSEGLPLSVALYPGFYRLFESTPDLGGDDGLAVLALPGSDGSGYNPDSIDFSAIMTGPLVEDDAIESRLNGALASWLDDCADSADLWPAGCPFSAAHDYGVAHDGSNEFSSVTELDWTVETYPKVRLSRDLRLEAVVPGWVTLTGKGTELFEDDETALEGRCSVDVANIAATIGGDGALSFALIEDQWNTCR
jgi:hypothetical protein